MENKRIYVVIGTYPNGTKRPYRVWAETPTEAITKTMAYESESSGSHLINIDVIESYGDVPVLK